MDTNFLNDPFFKQPKQPRPNQFFSPSAYLESVAKQYGGLPDREDPTYKKISKDMELRRKKELMAMDALAYENESLNQELDSSYAHISRYDNFTRSLQSEISKIKAEYAQLRTELDGYKRSTSTSGRDAGVPLLHEAAGEAARADDAERQAGAPGDGDAAVARAGPDGDETDNWERVDADARAAEPDAPGVE